MHLMRLASPTSRAAGFPTRRAARLRSTGKLGAPAPAKRAHVVVSFAERGGRADGDDENSKKPDDAEEEDGADEDDDAPPSLPAGAWRNFRASLVASAAAAAGEKPGPSGDVWSARWTPENVHLFQEQDRELAREPLWVHALEGGLPELGGLIVATPEAVSLTGDARRAQLVCYVAKHDPQEGSVALILNRPATAALGDLLGWGLRFGDGNKGGGEGEDEGPSTSSSPPSSALVEAAFGDAPVYLGGFFSPARISAQPLTLLHGIPGLPGATEVVPGGGVFSGGVAAAAEAVVSGEQPASRCRLFAGALAWPPGGLAAEVEGGVWFAAASSRAVVLKPCLGLPVPLWRECLGLMGGEYARAARRRG